MSCSLPPLWYRYSVPPPRQRSTVKVKVLGDWGTERGGIYHWTPAARKAEGRRSVQFRKREAFRARLCFEERKAGGGLPWVRCSEGERGRRRCRGRQCRPHPNAAHEDLQSNRRKNNSQVVKGDHLAATPLPYRRVARPCKCPCAYTHLPTHARDQAHAGAHVCICTCAPLRIWVRPHARASCSWLGGTGRRTPAQTAPRSRALRARCCCTGSRAAAACRAAAGGTCGGCRSGRTPCGATRR